MGNHIQENGLTYYDNGSVKMEAKFRNGLKDGKRLKFISKMARLNEIRSYKKNEMDGKWVMYNSHNIKISVAHYKNGKKDGKWFIWNDYGNLLYEFSTVMEKKPVSGKTTMKRVN